MKYSIAACLSCLLVSLSAGAQQMSQLSFMSGNWLVKKGTGEVRENWLGPQGEVMVAANLTSREGKPGQFEFLRIAKKDGKIVYFASPGGRPAVEFPVKELSDRRVVFENPAHDFPQRIIYARIDDNTLLARIEGQMQGKEVNEEWRFTRAP